jgi:hypothetical protein
MAALSWFTAVLWINASRSASYAQDHWVPEPATCRTRTNAIPSRFLSKLLFGEIRVSLFSVIR